MTVPAPERRIVNLFMVYSPLHCLCADHIVRHFENGARNVLFYLKAGYASYVDSSLWDGIHYLPWPRFNPLPGPFGRLRRTLSNLDFVASQCQGAEEIRLHTTVIDTEAVNYNINYLKRQFPNVEFSVRLFPDGVLNLRKHPLGPVQELLQYMRAARMLVAPSLRYYRFRGDRTGSDDAIVDRIYVLPRFPHKYEPSKTVVLPEFDMASPESRGEPADKKALVVGQYLVGVDLLTRGQIKRIGVAISGIIADAGITNIDYKAHPRDRNFELFEEGYRHLSIDIPLESYLVNNPYDLVVGIFSTALITARYILPADCRVVACGIEEVSFKENSTRDGIVSLFNLLGIEIIQASKGT